MGSIRTIGDANTAPRYSNNASGTPKWSGKHVAELDSEMLLNMQSFIVYEANRQGYNDSVNHRIGSNEQFFHDKFLDGWAQLLWHQYYWFGVNDQK